MSSSISKHIDSCQICWTSSWAPCPKEYPNAVPAGNNWMMCQMCAVNERLRTVEEQLRLSRRLHRLSAERLVEKGQPR